MTSEVRNVHTLQIYQHQSQEVIVSLDFKVSKLLPPPLSSNQLIDPDLVGVYVTKQLLAENLYVCACMAKTVRCEIGVSYCLFIVKEISLLR